MHALIQGNVAPGQLKPGVVTPENDSLLYGASIDFNSKMEILDDEGEDEAVMKTEPTTKTMKSVNRKRRAPAEIWADFDSESQMLVSIKTITVSMSTKVPVVRLATIRISGQDDERANMKFGADRSGSQATLDITRQDVPATAADDV